MNILMLAPEPFFEPRGTPISIRFRIQALGELGHSVTLVTYPIGKDVPLKGLRIVRPPNLLGMRKIKIGPSLAKLPLDLLLFLRAVLEIGLHPYDLVFSHEEAALIGVWLARIWGKPHIYDMHSSLPQQLENFEFTRSPLLVSLFRRMERFVLRNSDSIIVICRDLMETVAGLGYGEKALLVENFLDFPACEYPAGVVAAKRKEFAPGGEKIVVYTGNFGPYQGIPLLLRAAQKVGPGAVFVLVGGSGESLQAMKALAAELGISSKVVFVDRVPPSEVSLYVALADVLVSPRTSGTNTPLKLYSCLKSGKPLVATRLWTHTQVLSESQAILADPNAADFARGIDFALYNPEARARAQAAKEWAEKEYAPSRYLERISQVLSLARRNHSG
jgi:glycosyltransferase involved in cell wall biosynthesis